jgi:two-component system, cell cycle response regulator
LAESTLNRCPDAFLIEADRATVPDALRLLAELRSRSQTRNAAICLQLPHDLAEEATVALDLGASDVVSTAVETRELGLRLRRMIARKREGDRVRASLRDGLRLAMVDPLTGLFNRRYALRRLAEIADEAMTREQPFAVMVLDLDRFKQINDQLGHAAGDAVLTEVGRRLAANIRPGDLLARIGGEEFLIALPGADLSLAKPVAERLCATIEQEPFVLREAGPVRLTASVGLAIRMHDDHIGEEVDATIERADQALLGAKSSGRNQVRISRSAA